MFELYKNIFEKEVHSFLDKIEKRAGKTLSKCKNISIKMSIFSYPYLKKKVSPDKSITINEVRVSHHLFYPPPTRFF